MAGTEAAIAARLDRLPSSRELFRRLMPAIALIETSDLT